MTRETPTPCWYVGALGPVSVSAHRQHDRDRRPCWPCAADGSATGSPLTHRYPDTEAVA